MNTWLKGVLSTPFGQDHYSHLCVCHICSRATILGLHHFFRRARFCCLDPSFHFVSPRTVEKNLVVTIGEEEDSTLTPSKKSAHQCFGTCLTRKPSHFFVTWAQASTTTTARRQHFLSGITCTGLSRLTPSLVGHWRDRAVWFMICILPLGRESTVPLFVSGTYGSTTGLQFFLVVWSSILPFLYVSYFFCMYALVPLSPRVKIQRGLCIFAIAHFLFFTDVIACRYG